jgi:hypothetical protein
MGDPELQKQFETEYMIYLSDQLSLLNSPFIKNDAWKSSVLKDLLSIRLTRVGSLLLRSIRYWGQIVWIEPFLADPTKGCNATTAPVDKNSVDGKLSDDPKDAVGSITHYTPSFLGPGSFCSKKDGRFGGYTNLSFETLFHELVHALRFVSGMNNKGVGMTKGLTFYGNKEEFIAVLVQGIFASELKRPVRSSHEMHFEINPELNGSYKFFSSGSEAYRFVKEFCTDNQGFTKALACIEVPFNPIRAYYEKPALAKSISLNSSVAARRDQIAGPVFALKELIKTFL